MKKKMTVFIFSVLILSLAFVIWGCGIIDSDASDEDSHFDNFEGTWVGVDIEGDDIDFDDRRLERYKFIEIRKEVGGVFELYYEYEIHDELYTSEWQLKRDPDEGQLYLMDDRKDNFTYDADNDQLINRKSGVKLIYDRK